MQWLSKTANKAGAKLGLVEEKKESGFHLPSADEVDEKLCEACGLGRMQRYMCFGGCFVLGWVCGWMAFISLTNPPKFAIIYTVGNLIALGGGFFLSGPCNQLKKMFAEKRFIATGIYLVMMILTLVLALKEAPIVLILLSALGQFLAMTWYFLSYIPYARTVVKNCATSVCPV